MSEQKKMRRGGRVEIEPVCGGFIVSYYDEDGDNQKIIANSFGDAVGLLAVAIGFVSYAGHLRVEVRRDD